MLRSNLLPCGVALLWMGCTRSLPPPLEATVVVPAGRHVLGAPAEEPCRAGEPAPREVALGSLEVDVTEATQASWAALDGLPADPTWGPHCPTCPVDSITRSEAQAYCAARSRARGLPVCDTCADTPSGLECVPVAGACAGLRLPTGAEWEAVARAGAATSTAAGDVTVCMRHDPLVATLGWTKTTSGGAPHPVDGRARNGLGVADVVGNLAEWTADPLDAQGLAALRGGSWYHNAEHVRAAAELRAPPAQRLSWAGVRCVRSLP